MELSVGLFAETLQAALRRKHHKHLNQFGQNHISQAPWRQTFVLLDRIEFWILWATNSYEPQINIYIICYLFCILK